MNESDERYSTAEDAIYDAFFLLDNYLDVVLGTYGHFHQEATPLFYGRLNGLDNLFFLHRL